MRNNAIHWQAPPIDLRFMENEVHVWCVPLDCDDERLYRYLQDLAPDERERADRFHFKRHKCRYIVGRGVLRNLLSKYLDIEPRLIEFYYSSRGKPSLRYQPTQGNLFFNLSHSHELALYVIAPCPFVGIDVEQVRQVADFEGISRINFFPKEHQKIRAVEDDEKIALFLDYWTCKEAFLKAIGAGISDLRKIEILFEPTGNVALGAGTERYTENQDWLVKPFRPKIGYSAALALSGNHWQVKHFFHRA